MDADEPTIVSIDPSGRGAMTSYIGEPPSLLNHVHARMSDGTPVRILAYDPQTIAIDEDALIGLTVAQAREMGRHKGALIPGEGTAPVGSKSR